MLTELEKTSGIEKSVLLPEIKKVHEGHGTAEYAFLIQELPSILKKHPSADKKEVVDFYNSSVHAYSPLKSGLLMT